MLLGLPVNTHPRDIDGEACATPLALMTHTGIVTEAQHRAATFYRWVWFKAWNRLESVGVSLYAERIIDHDAPIEGPPQLYRDAEAVFDTALREAGQRVRQETRNVTLFEHSPAWIRALFDGAVHIRDSHAPDLAALLAGLRAVEAVASDAADIMHSQAPAVRGVA